MFSTEHQRSTLLSTSTLAIHSSTAGGFPEPDSTRTLAGCWPERHITQA
jgi:hypothetical protein